MSKAHIQEGAVTLAVRSVMSIAKNTMLAAADTGRLMPQNFPKTKPYEYIHPARSKSNLSTPETSMATQHRVVVNGQCHRA